MLHCQMGRPTAFLTCWFIFPIQSLLVCQFSMADGSISVVVIVSAFLSVLFPSVLVGGNTFYHGIFVYSRQFAILLLCGCLLMVAGQCME